MTHEEQTRIDMIVAKKVMEIRDTKGKEYATEEDTLADFKEVAEEAGITPLQCWATYVKKHERAIDTYIREGAVRSEGIEDRILDVIVYHHLLLGLILENPEHSGFLWKENPFNELPEVRVTSPSASPIRERPEDQHQGLSDPMG